MPRTVNQSSRKFQTCFQFIPNSLQMVKPSSYVRLPFPNKLMMFCSVVVVNTPTV